MKRQFYSQKIFSLSFVTAMAMVGLEVSAWVAVFCIFMLFWKWGVERRGWKPLPRKVTGVLSLLFLVQVLIQFRTLIGQEPSFTYLLALSALRIMDYETERDHKFVVLLGFLLISVKSLFTLDIYWIVPSILAFMGLWYSILPTQLPEKFRVLGKLFLFSVPLAALLFFAFPRFVLPWALSRGGGGGSLGGMGFTDELTPGGVAELASNPNVAFRAKLAQMSGIKSSDLYWRGSVLSLSQGLSWKPSGTVFKNQEPQVEGPFYEVAIEPTSQRYIFVLDGTRFVEAEGNTVYPLQHSIYRLRKPISSSSMYRGILQKDWVDQEKPKEEFLQTPAVGEKVSQWAEDIKNRNLSPEDRLSELQKLFSEGGFLYTLSPGTYNENGLEEFVFKRRRGFCEHFAGAYATLARLLEVPSRVVIGYQGGRYNPLGDFWKISQKDAHAWVEVYVDGVWRRVDPTSWVAPLRLVIGGEEFFALSEEDQKAFARSVDWKPTADGSAFFDRVGFWIEDLNYRWTYFLIDFDKSSQQSFWQSLAQYKAKALISVLVFILCFIFVYRFFFVKNISLDEEQKLIQEIELWGAKQGVERFSSEPPLSYLARLSEKFPKVRELLGEVAVFYDQRVYANQSAISKGLLKSWRENKNKA